MRVSLRWLSDYVNVDVPAEKLRDLLDLSGTKVETVTRPGESIRDVVVARVDAIEPHPNADNLVLVDVTTGSDHTRVVCGARNFAVGDRVPLAVVGARLPGIEISERKIRGQVSRGMLCSGLELGVSKDHSGILVLPDDTDLGADVAAVLGLDDTILELEITPNRPDCMGLIGIAREVAALLGTDFRIPEVESPGGGAAPVEVHIEDTKGCSRYIARFVNKVAVGPSPAWLARRLIAAGLRPISNIVDVTNYVMMETGQPLHAFDAAGVQDGRIVVRRARAREKLAFLDGVTRKLDRDDLMICDPAGVLALAGVMGGAQSEVSDSTSAVVLEAAHFDPATIAFAGRRHGLRTEASIRFERGVDPGGVAYASDRAVLLFAELAGGAAGYEPVDEYPVPATRVRLRLRPDRTTKVLGLSLSAEAQAAHLRSVGLAVTALDGDLQVEVPTFRPDITREEDLIEEVARLAGFESLPSTVPPGGTGGLTGAQRAERVVRTALTSRGLFEAWTTSFGAAGDLDALGLPEDHPARSMVRIVNPMNEEEPALRTTLLPGLLRSIRHNLAHALPGVALFEMARVYEPTSEPLPREATVLAAAMTGVRVHESWTGPAREWDFYSARGALDFVFRSVGLGDPSYVAVGGPPFHPTRAAAVLAGGAQIGAIGELHPAVSRAFDVPERTITFEIALGPLLAALPDKSTIEELPRFPPALIDLAVVVDDALLAGRVHEVIVKAGAPEIASVRLFDVYRGSQIPPGKKSLAYALELRRPEGTLTDEDALAVRDRIVNALAERVGAELRA